MGKDTYDLGGGYARPAEESIDEALARLARQDGRIGADGAIIPSTTTAAPVAPSPSAPTRAALAAQQARVAAQVRRSSVPPPLGYQPPAPGTRSTLRAPTPTAPPPRRSGLPIVRWLIILAMAWFFLRFFLR